MTQESEPQFIQESDADLTTLVDKRIAVVGYGNLGRPFSLNIRDSCIAPIVVGELPGPAWERALADEFPVMSAEAAAADADVIFVLVPDELAPAVYQENLSPGLVRGNAVVFASGLNLAFGQITPDPGLDVLLIAPRMLGAGIRDLYQNGRGFPSFVSVEQDASGGGWQLLCALAKAVGSLRAGALKVSAAQEARVDLFVEQTVGPDLACAILSAFQVGVEAGLPPEALLLDLYMSGEMGRSIQAMAEQGFFQQVKLHGYAAAYGGMIRFMGLDREARASSYRKVYQEIADGEFAEALRNEVEAGFPSQPLLDDMTTGDNPISLAEERIRKMIHLGTDDSTSK